MRVPRPPRSPALIVLVILAGVLLAGLAVVAVDRIAAARAQTAIEAEVGEAVAAEVDARIQGRLAGLRALVGRRIDRLDLEAELVPVPDAGVVIDRLTVTVLDLELDGDGRPSAGTGTFEASFSEEQVRVAVPAAVGGSLRLGATALLLDVGIAAIPLELLVSDNTLRVELPLDLPILDQAVGSATEVPLIVPDGVDVRDVEVRGGVLLLTGDLDPVVVGNR